MLEFIRRIYKAEHISTLKWLTMLEFIWRFYTTRHISTLKWSTMLNIFEEFTRQSIFQHWSDKLCLNLFAEFTRQSIFQHWSDQLCIYFSALKARECCWHFECQNTSDLFSIQSSLYRVRYSQGYYTRNVEHELNSLSCYFLIISLGKCLWHVPCIKCEIKRIHNCTRKKSTCTFL